MPDRRWAPFHVPGIPGRRARDRIMMACRDAWFWDVIITGSDGRCIGAIISPADAEILQEAKARLAEGKQQ